MDADDNSDGLASLAPGARRVPRGVRLRIGVGAGIVLLIAALVVAVAVSALAPHGSSQTVTAVTAASGASQGSTDAPGGPASTDGPATPLFVHVLGAVKDPGLFQLHDGARVVDAVAAAGGFTNDAEQGGVNLARVVSDGEQLVVPRVGETPPVSAGGGGAAGAPGVAEPGAKVNINTATATELEALPRIGPAMAQRIVDWRTANGRFSTIDDLMSVTGIGEKTFDGLKDQVTV